MPDLASPVAAQRAAIIATAMEDVVAELRLVDPADIIGDIRAGRWANIADLVQSSAELSFREDALTFACSADFTLDWTNGPAVALDMEFVGPALSAFFTLFLDRAAASVALHHVWFALEPEGADAGTALLRTAVSDARRIPAAPIARERRS